MQIAALVSGGVDSSVMLHLLKEQGHEPVIFYILIGMKDKEGFLDCPSEEDIEITTWLVKKVWAENGNSHPSGRVLGQCRCLYARFCKKRADAQSRCDV